MTIINTINLISIQFVLSVDYCYCWEPWDFNQYLKIKEAEVTDDVEITFRLKCSISVKFLSD